MSHPHPVLVAGWVVVATLAAWVAPSLAAPPSASSIAQRFECHRCHETALARPPRLSQDCRGCHQGIVDGRVGRGGDGERWRPHVEDLAAVPSLKLVRGRLRASFIRDVLLDPDGVGDIRPHLRQSMPRLPLTVDEATTLAAALAGPEPGPGPPVDVAAVARGRARFATFGCAACHAFTGVSPSTASSSMATPSPGHRAGWLAPDLALARRRLMPSFVAAFIENPRAHDPHTAMPDLGVSADDARDLAAFILGAPLASPSSRPVGPTASSLPTIARPVAWAEVRQRVIETSCWHCHQTPAGRSNDGGPGVAGGFGFAPRGIDLMRHDVIVDGRSGLLATEPVTGASRLVAALLARHHEVGGGRVAGVTGMPLGLPPLSLDDIAVVQAWVQQGAPGPDP